MKLVFLGHPILLAYDKKKSCCYGVPNHFPLYASSIFAKYPMNFCMK
jgi:hypothetical protein